MDTSKYIDSSIELLKKMLADANNELTSGQRKDLEKGIRELKKLKKAKTPNRIAVRATVKLIAETLLMNVSTEVVS